MNLLKIHNIIDSIFYKKLCNYKLPNENYEWMLLPTNGLNIIDGLFEIGSERIYGDDNKIIKK